MFIFYEFLGTAIIQFVVNFTTGSLATEACIIASLISWELSAAHFNIGLTIAELFTEYSRIKETW